VFHDISADMQQVMRELEEQTERDHGRFAVFSRTSDAAFQCWQCRRPGYISRAGQQRWLLQSVAIAGRARARRDPHDGRSRRKQSRVGSREHLTRGRGSFVQVFHGDALDYATRFEEIAFCFSDIEPPENNAKVYEEVVPRLVPGGWLVIDNVTSPRIQTELLNHAEKIRE